MTLPRHSVLLSALLVSAASLAHAKVYLVAPPPQSSHSPGPAPLIGFCDDPVKKSFSVSVNGKAIAVESSEGVFAGEAMWIAGRNEVLVEGEAFVVTLETSGGITQHPGLLDHCGDCHPLGSQRQLKPEKPLDALCLSCHDRIDKGWNDASEHAQADGCRNCHHPHKGKGKALLTFSKSEGCLACHDSPAAAKGGAPPPNFVHGPLNSGGCTDCHDWHTDRGDAQLSSTGSELCGECHNLPLSTGAKPAAVSPHPPVRQGKCSLCHDPHAADNEHFLRSDANEVCEGCHNLNSHRHTLSSKTRLGGIKVPLSWPRSKKALACWGCHMGHGSTEPAFLTAPKSRLCKSCHQ